MELLEFAAAMLWTVIALVVGLAVVVFFSQPPSERDAIFHLWNTERGKATQRRTGVQAELFRA
jgi:hypothetical protein